MALTKRELEILELRNRRLTQQQIAKRLKITQPAISRMERNAHKKIKDAVETLNLIKKMGVKIEK